MIKTIDLVRRATGPLVALGLAATAIPASALTAASIPDAVDAPTVTPVSGGCGVYAHRTAYGYCRSNVVRFGYRGYGCGYGYRDFGIHGYDAHHRGYGYDRGWGSRGRW